MFDVSWSELGLVAIVALLVVGPKDFPLLMRKGGHWLRRARLAWDGLKMQLHDAADQAELAALHQQTRDITLAAEKMPPLPDNPDLPNTAAVEPDDEKRD